MELFYYFVQAESGAAAAADDTPFLFWLTGGDRCSVFSGLAYEIGTPSIWMMHGVGVSDFDLPCVKNKMLDALSLASQVPSDSSWNPTTAPCRACDTTTTRGQR